jgi:hypothetical protein
MSIINSKTRRRHVAIDPIFILLFSALALLTILAVSTGNTEHLVESAVDTLGGLSVSVPINNELSFASDQNYWASNCTRGWSSDSLCNTIAGRTQACELSADSAYCSAYDQYLKQIGK